MISAPDKKMGIYLVLTFFLLLAAACANKPESSKSPDFWNSDEARKWVESGLFDGFDKDAFRPKEAIRRSELAVLMSRIFKYSNKNKAVFADVPADSWFADDVYGVAAAGIMGEWTKGRFSPDTRVSRQDFAVILYKAFGLKGDAQKIINNYRNIENIPSKYKKAIYEIVEKNYIASTPGKVLRLKDAVTREEVVRTLDRLAHTLITKPGIYKGSHKGNVVVNTGDVTLKGMTVEGDLYIAEGVGDGTVTIDSTGIRGKIIVHGGGETAILLKNSSRADEIIVNERNGKAGVAVEGKTSVARVELYSGASLRETGCAEDTGFGDVTVVQTKTGQPIKLNGVFSSLRLEGPGTVLQFEGGSTGEIYIDGSALHTSIDIVSGNIGKMNVHAKSTINIKDGVISVMDMDKNSAGSSIIVGDKAKVSNLAADASIEVGGKGRIEKAVVNALKVTMEIKPENLDASAGTEVVEKKGEGGLVHGIVTGRYYSEMAAEPEMFFDDWYNMNLGWIRIEFEEFMYSNNGNVETAYEDPSVLKAKEKYTTIIKKAHDKGIKVLAIVGLNSMPHGTLKPFSETSIQNYVESVEWHLRNYAVDAIEIANEPWGYYCSPNPEDLKWYARMMIDTYERLKPSYPNVVFLAPVSANAEQGEWLGWHNWSKPKLEAENSIFNCNAMQDYRNRHDGMLPLDAFSWHPYGAGGDPATLKFFFGRDFLTFHDQVTGKIPMIMGDGKTVIWFKDIAGRPIVGDYPIWFTEYSWDSKRIGYTNHRDYIERMMQLIAKRPQVKVAFIYTYRDDELGPGTEYKDHGLRKNSRSSFEFKPAYYSFFANSSRVGLKSKDVKTVDAIIKAYIKEGGRSRLGIPYGYQEGADKGVQEVQGGLIQYFADKLGKSAIVKKDGFREAYVLKGVFYEYFAVNGLDTTGFPVSNQYDASGDGCIYQNFEKGKLKWKYNEEQATFEKIPGGLTPAYSMIGVSDDGTIDEEIISKYELFGEEKMGMPVDGTEGKVNRLGTFAVIQEFDGGSFGRCALVKNNDKDDVYIISAEMLEYYKANDGRSNLGWPVTDTVQEKGVIFQYFQKARLKFENGTVTMETWAELGNKK